MKNITWDIVPRKEITTSSNQIPLVLRVRVNGKYFKHSLGFSISDLKHWDPKHKQIRNSASLDPSEANRQLASTVKKVSSIIANARINEKVLTRDKFAAHYFGSNFTSGDSFYDFCTEEVNYMKKAGFARETIRSYESYISKLKKFRLEVLFGDISMDLIRAIEVYMEGLGNQQNTKQKMFAFMNTMLNRAKKQGIIQENILDHNMPVKKKEGQREFLTIEELKKLQGLKPASKNLAEVLKYFLFACYTGLRFTDLRNLRFANIVLIDEVKHIRLIMHKTKEEVTIPLGTQALALIPGFSFPNQKIFRVRCNQVSNRDLKTIMELAGIYKKISMHCARHTFATVSLSLGMGIKTISEILGHTEIKTTQLYTKVQNRYKIEEMNKWNRIYC